MRTNSQAAQLPYPNPLSTQVHYAEADNELHHLLIMESLGGSKEVVDRLLAGNAAVAYYWLVVVMYMVNPRGAYHLSQLIEDHAWKTYDKFLKENEEFLRAQNAPQVHHHCTPQLTPGCQPANSKPHATLPALFKQ